MLVRILGWLAAALIAIGAGLTSYAISNQVKSPAKVIGLGVLPDANASGNFALLSLATRKARDPEATVNKAERRLALHAYRNEPLSASSVGLLAVSTTGRAAAATQQNLLELAGRLTRRSAFVSSELINAAGRRDDEPQIFQWLSRVMLTSPDVRKIYGAAMADATAKEGAVAALTPILGVEPAWANYYWRLVVGRPASLVNAARLRSAIARAPWRQTEILPTDLRMMRRLAATGEFEVAHQLAHGLGLRRSGSIANNLLTNGDFASAPAMPPFDWDLAALGNLGASIDTDQKQLAISAIAGARGSAARQLVRLSPDTYRLAWSLSAGSPFPPGALSVRIGCAEAGGDESLTAVIPLVEGKRQVSVNIRDQSCAWYWVSIDTNIPDDSMGVDAEIGDFSLTASGPDPANPR